MSQEEKMSGVKITEDDLDLLSKLTGIDVEVLKKKFGFDTTPQVKPEVQPNANQIKIGNSVVDVLEHMKDIKEALDNVRFVLNRFYNKKQFLTWMAEESSANPCSAQLDITPTYDVSGENRYGCWYIELYKIDEEFLNADWSWADASSGGIESRLDCCVFKDDSGQLWFAVCDLD